MKYNKLINKAEDYIELNLSNNITINNLAKHVFMSEYHFHRIFKQYSTETIHQFIVRIKLERSAVFLITNHFIRITDIAQQYGYCDASAYCKAFKKYFHTTPTIFRNSKNIQSNYIHSIYNSNMKERGT